MMAAAPRDLVVDYWIEPNTQAFWSNISTGGTQEQDLRLGGTIKALYFAVTDNGHSGMHKLTDADTVTVDGANGVKSLTSASGEDFIHSLSISYESTLVGAYQEVFLPFRVLPYYHCPSVSHSDKDRGWNAIPYALNAGSNDVGGSVNLGKVITFLIRLRVLIPARLAVVLITRF